ncbi:MAG TPA: transcriptional regulator [Aurantimonas coralicida]|uniref:Transcriptional regulator n=2 Tax=root TaxID=1 RepID=A0A9C9NJQ5_9HYPH|nr:transcriptional regulator [Aurantimonas coralicida]HEU02759.1 transcriptional regulator [Aurantimonas coralicida]
MSKVVKSNMLELDARAAGVAAILALMGNAHRLRILCKLAEDEASVGVLVSEVGLSQSALSQHLAKLRAGGLVTTRRDAQTIFYSLASDDVRAIIASLYDVFCAHRKRHAAP